MKFQPKKAQSIVLIVKHYLIYLIGKTHVKVIAPLGLKQLHLVGN